MSALTITPRQGVFRNWWLLLISGIILIAIGIWIISVPLGAYLTISIVLALGTVITGVLELAMAVFSYRGSTGMHWALIGGFVDLFIGIYLLNYPLITIILLPIFVGFWLLLRGVTALGHAWQMRDNQVDDWAYLTLVGLILLFIGIMILFNLIWSIVDLIVWTAAGMIAAGAFRIYLSIKLRQLHHKLG